MSKPEKETFLTRKCIGFVTEYQRSIQQYDLLADIWAEEIEDALGECNYW